MHRSVRGYITFLNSNDWTIFHRSQPATWTEPFWSTHQLSGDIADILSGDIVNTVDTWTTGLDVYDPALEQDLNTVTDTSLSGASGQDFWFTTDGQTTGATTSSWSTSKSALLNALKQSPSVNK